MQKVRFVTAAMALALVGCGGGSSGGGGSTGSSGGGTANRPPAFVGASNFNVVENTRDVATIGTNDPDGDAVTIEFVAGKDAALFTFVGSPGNLGFLNEPSWETPLDANGDNIYEVDLRISDGTASVVRTFQITVSNDKEGIDVRRIATGLGANGSLSYWSDIDELVAISEGGEISRINPSTRAVTVTGQMGGLAAGARILDSWGPDFTFLNGRIYVLVLEDRQLSVRRVEVADPTNVEHVWTHDFGPGTAPIEATIGSLGSNPILAFGDGRMPDEAQNTATLFGTIVEFRTNGALFDHSTPDPQLRLIGLGVRSPVFPHYQGSNTGWVIDRGEAFSEIDYAGFEFQVGQGPANLEWPFRDGLTDISTPGSIVGDRVTAGVVQQLVSGEVGVWTDALARFDGRFFFDSLGNAFSLSDNPADVVENRNVDFTPDAGAIDGIVSARLGDNGLQQSLFLLDSDGELFASAAQ